MRIVLVTLLTVFVSGCTSSSLKSLSPLTFYEAMGVLVGRDIRAEQLIVENKKMLCSNVGWFVLPEAYAKPLAALYQKGVIEPSRLTDSSLADWRVFSAESGYRLINQRSSLTLYLLPNYMIALPPEFDARVLQTKSILESASGGTPAPIIVVPPLAR